MTQLDPYGLRPRFAALANPRTEESNEYTLTVGPNATIHFELTGHTCQIVYTEARKAYMKRAKERKQTPSSVVDAATDLANIPIEALIELTGFMEQDNQRRYDRDVMQLLAEVNKLAILLDQKRVERIVTGTLAFSDLPLFFGKGMPVLARGAAYGEDVAAVTQEVEVGYSFMGGAFITVTALCYAAGPQGEIQPSKTTFRIGDYDGFQDAMELPIVPLMDADRTRLAARGQRFVDILKSGCAYAMYSGNLFIPSFFGTRTFRADGRIMVDPAGVSRFEPDVARALRGQVQPFNKAHNPYDDDATPGDNLAGLTPEQLPYAYPTLPAFSFRTRKWGAVLVSQISEIEFRSDAIDKLVIPADRKQMMLALVKNSQETFTDLIDGKSGGTIFLLAGPPGVGKTLTAEATAEALQRPLYSISVGELGVEPDILEERLREVLDMAERWNAVILLDEADIFLEARNEHDITRNAMVGIFLRLLEYHTGVLFLTTNRAGNLDPAFRSRISLPLHYEGMTTATRRRVWTNLLIAANVPEIPVEQLAELPINGRQIKSAIRLAQALAREEKRSITEADLLQVATYALDFVADIEETPVTA